MAEQHALPTADAFEPRTGRVARAARWIGCSEGQLYSMVIGVLLLWVVSANALPSVVWDPSDIAAPAFERTPAGDDLAAAAPELPSAGLITEAPRPTFSPVTAPSTDFAPSAPPPAEDAGVLPDFDEGTEDPGPLRVVGGGYASAAAGSPLATFGVPEGSVAVANRGGQPFHVTFLRLEGRGPTLELDVDAEGANTLDALAGLSLCVVPSAGWQVGQGDVSLEEAPAYDCSHAVEGTRSDSGNQWSFDSSALDTSAIGGIAVVPSAASAAPEFQIVFTLEEG